jgi:hypothetical protein
MTIPEKGLYYHYKHDRDVFNNHAYEVFDIGRHTEDETLFVLYRPLYINEYLSPAKCFIRPLAMFMETVEWNGETVPRFKKITDPDLIAKLELVRDQMYSQ